MTEKKEKSFLLSILGPQDAGSKQRLQTPGPMARPAPVPLQSGCSPALIQRRKDGHVHRA